jgi:hypothetical protein
MDSGIQRWLVVLAIALVGGTLNDRIPPQEPERRGGYLVIESDLHVHTRYSDGFLSPFEVVLAARRHGLHAIAVTEHNVVFPARMAAWLSQRIDGPTVIIGEEVTARGYHLLALGIREAVAPRPTARETALAIQAQGGIAVAAHPTARFQPALDEALDVLDGAEVVHPLAHGGFGAKDFRYEQMVDFYERAARDDPGFLAVGASDYHFFKLIGMCRTYVFARDATEASILEALRAGRAVSIAPDGRHFGDASLIELLAREPLAERPAAVGYAPSSGLDALFRLVGWLGMIGLVLLRVRRRPAKP